MRKKCNRKAIVPSEPAMVQLITTPEIGIAERMAIQAMRSGWADYHNSYRVLADCHGILTIGLHRKKDDSMDGILQAGLIAMLNIYDRYNELKKVGATGDELSALEMMVDVSEDFWKRQTAKFFRESIAMLGVVRGRQIEAGKKKLGIA